MALLNMRCTATELSLCRTVWFAINVFCLICLWRLAWRMTGGGRLEGAQSNNKENLVCFLGLACSARYALNGIAHQQTDIVIGALFLLGCLSLSRNRGLLAAGCFGLAAAMKCTGLLWCPYLLWKRQWKAACWLIV